MIKNTLINCNKRDTKMILTAKQVITMKPLVDGVVMEFEDGTKINTKDLDYKLVKPLIWWE